MPLGRRVYGPKCQRFTSYEDGRRSPHFVGNLNVNFDAQALASLESQTDLPFEVYDRVVTEPTEASWRDAIAWSRQHDCSHFLAYV